MRKTNSEATPGATSRNGTGVVDAPWIEQWLADRIAVLRGTDAEQVDLGGSFLANGVSSAGSVALTADLAKALQITLPDTLAWEFPSIAELAVQVAARYRVHRGPTAPEQP